MNIKKILEKEFADLDIDETDWAPRVWSKEKEAIIELIKLLVLGAENNEEMVILKGFHDRIERIGIHEDDLCYEDNIH